MIKRYILTGYLIRFDLIVFSIFFSLFFLKRKHGKKKEKNGCVTKITPYKWYYYIKDIPNYTRNWISFKQKKNYYLNYTHNDDNEKTMMFFFLLFLLFIYLFIYIYMYIFYIPYNKSYKLFIYIYIYIHT